MTISELLLEACEALVDVGIDEAKTEATLLLGHCLDKSRTELFLAAQDQVEKESEIYFRNLLSQRLARKPLAYLSGEREFWSLLFTVSPAVLIPRPETEFLLECVFSQFNDKKNRLPDGKILDLCCGSGVIATVLAKELNKNVIASDLSWEALAVAKKNSKRHLKDVIIQFVQGDLLSFLTDRQQFSLIVSNPPYIKSKVIDYELQPEVADYEPRLALDGGVSGLTVIKRICRELPGRLLSGGHFFMEIGADQGRQVGEMFENFFINENRSFTSVEIYQDYSGRDRVLHLIKG